MQRHNVFLSSLKFVLIEVIGDIIYFPVWWYTAGFLKIAEHTWQSSRDILDSFNIPILFRHLLTPMYGDYSWSGRTISFFVRIVHFFIMFLVALVWIIVVAAGGLLWLLLPIVVAYTIFYQVFHLSDTHLFIRFLNV